MAAVSPTESNLAAGALLVGKYRVVREIGRGGMAAVYEAEQLSLGKHVAIKVLAQELAQSTIVIERFFREARAAASVKSPHIVDVYDSGRLEDGRPFIAMELLEGESLYDRMARIRLIDPITTVRIIAHCAKGLAKAHAAGIVHRDLKPENIFLTRSEDGDEIAKLLDFGLAKFYAPMNPEGGEKVKRLTREGAVFGTPAYMSPEQVKGQGNVDHRADLWALGCMAYECLTGRPVWNMDQGVAMTFAAIATSPFPIPSKMRPDLPPAFDAWFKRALEREVDARFQSAKELADALADVWGATASQTNIRSDPRAMAATQASGPQAPVMAPGVAASPSGRAVGSDPVVTSQSSLPIPLLMPSEAELKAIAHESKPVTNAGPARLAVSLLVFVGGLSVAVGAYVRYLKPQVFVPVAVSTSSAVPSTQASSMVPETDEDEPKWAAVLGEGQKLFSAGDTAGATKKFQEAQGMQGAAAVAKVFLDQTALPSTGACKLSAFSHPRAGITIPAGRPTIALGPKGALVAWTDNRKDAKQSHTWAAVIDANGRTITKAVDLTPEAATAVRPQLLPATDGFALLYWDAAGKEGGVRVRKIDPNGWISPTEGRSRLVGAARPGQFWPSFDKTALGYFVVWQDDRDKEGADLFFRRLTPELETASPETRLTDYVPARGRANAPSVHAPSVAVAGNSLIVAYRLERDANRSIYRMRVPLSSPDLARGLDEGKDSKRDRELGDVELVNKDKKPADAPAIACGAEGCFIVWHGEQGGSYAALIDPLQGKVVWHNSFAPKGGHPGLGVSASGDVVVAYFEAGRVKVAKVSRSGVGEGSPVARIIGSDHPRPWIAPGAQKGEWYVAWEDTEAGHTEPYAARVSCR